MRVEKTKYTVIKDYSKGNRRFKKARYEKAKSMYEQLDGQVNVPKVMSSSDMVLELEKIEDKPLTESDHEALCEELLKFQFSNVKPKESLILKIVDNPSVRMFFETLYALPKIGFFSAVKTLLLLLRYILFFRLDEKILIHNDLNKGNVKMHKGQVCFIDLESTTTSKKWVFKDIMHYAIDQKTFKVDEELVRNYEKELKKNVSNTNFSIDKKISALFYMIRRLTKNKNSKGNVENYITHLNQ